MLSLKDDKEHTRLTAVVLRTGKYSAQLKRLFLTKYLIWSDVKAKNVHFSRRDYFKLEPQYSLVHQLVGFCDEQDIFKQLPLFNAVDKFINASEIISTTYSFSYRPFYS